MLPVDHRVLDHRFLFGRKTLPGKVDFESVEVIYKDRRLGRMPTGGRTVVPFSRATPSPLTAGQEPLAPVFDTGDEGVSKDDRNLSGGQDDGQSAIQFNPSLQHVS